MKEMKFFSTATFSLGAVNGAESRRVRPLVMRHGGLKPVADLEGDETMDAKHRKMVEERLAETMSWLELYDRKADHQKDDEAMSMRSALNNERAFLMKLLDLPKEG